MTGRTAALVATAVALAFYAPAALLILAVLYLAVDCVRTR